MRDIINAAMLAVLLSMTTGCAGILMSNAIHQGQDLTPEQIKAYNESGSAVYGCFQIGGPPPAGNTVWIVIPKGQPVAFKFGDNCHVVQ